MVTSRPVRGAILEVTLADEKKVPEKGLPIQCRHSSS